MTSTPRGRPGEDSRLQEALAILISSTHSKKRPLPLTEIAKWLEIAISYLGSNAAVADRIGLSPKMLRQFSFVSRLSPSVQLLFENRQLDSVDSAAHLASLPETDQEALAKALASGNLDTSDVRAVIQLIRNGGARTINQALQKVKSSKSRKEYVAEFVVRGGLTKPEITKLFQTYIPEKEIKAIEVRGALGRLTLTPKGRAALTNAARVLGVPFKRVISTILVRR